MLAGRLEHGPDQLSELRCMFGRWIYICGVEDMPLEEIQLGRTASSWNS